MLGTADEPDKLKITLESSEQYDDWLDELSDHVCSRPLWNIMTKDDSGEFLIEEPSCFKFRDFVDLPIAVLGQPPTPQQASYEAALEANSMHRELFMEQENEKLRIQRLIYHSVPKLIQYRLSWSRGLREWMVVIEEEMKPEPYVMEQATLEKYKAVMDKYHEGGPLSKWVEEWERVMYQVRRYNIPVYDSGQWLRDISSILPSEGAFLATDLWMRYSELRNRKTALHTQIRDVISTLKDQEPLAAEVPGAQVLNGIFEQCKEMSKEINYSPRDRLAPETVAEHIKCWAYFSKHQIVPRGNNYQTQGGAARNRVSKKSYRSKRQRRRAGQGGQQ